MELRKCKKCGELFYDKKQQGAWNMAALFTMGWSCVVEPNDREYCRDCVKD